jgi:hypothetical protein
MQVIYKIFTRPGKGEDGRAHLPRRYPRFTSFLVGQIPEKS